MGKDSKKIGKTISLVSKVALIYFGVKLIKKAVATCKNKCKK